MENSKREERRKQEDAALNRALLWFAAAVVLEFLLLLVNKYYINFTTAPESINLAMAFHTGLVVAAVAALLGAAGCAYWGWKRTQKEGKVPFLPVLVGISLLCMGISAILIRLFYAAAVHLLYLLVPAGAVVALVYYLYQREFFLSVCGMAVGLLGLWLVRKNAGNYTGVVTLYVALAAILLVVGVVFLFRLKNNGGELVVGGKRLRVLSNRANYVPVLLSWLVGLIAMAVGFLLGGTVAYYLLFVMMAWLFVLLVYYTVKLM